MEERSWDKGDQRNMIEIAGVISTFKDIYNFESGNDLIEDIYSSLKSRTKNAIRNLDDKLALAREPDYIPKQREKLDLTIRQLLNEKGIEGKAAKEISSYILNIYDENVNFKSAKKIEQLRIKRNLGITFTDDYRYRTDDF